MGSEGTADPEGGAMTEAGESEGGPPEADTAELGRVRALVLQAHPDVVPDLVRGASLNELLASVEPARSAYQQIAERVRGSAATQAPGAPASVIAISPPSVPAGGTAPVVDPGALSPTTKIARALAERRRA